MLKRLSRSLFFRLFVIFLLLGGAFVFGTVKAIQHFYNSDDVRGLISGHLSLHVHYVREDIGLPPRIEQARAITQSVPVDIRMFGPDLDWASDPNFPRLDELKFAPSPRFSDDPGAWIDELQGVEFAELGKHRFLKMRQGDYDIVVSTPRIADVTQGPDLVMQVLGLGLFLLLLGYGAVQWLFRPIRAIRASAAEIGHGNFKHRIARIRSDELGDLAADINTLAADVEQMLDAKRALLLAISHELRTPLSRMRLMLEFLTDEEQRAELRTEILEMEKIVSALLEAERLNTRHEQLSRDSVNTSKLVAGLLDDYFERERERIVVRYPMQAIIASLDEARVVLLLKNLLANALRYSSADDGPVELSMSVDGDDVVFVVSDHGPGIAPEQAAHIGEPFFRGDPSRARQSGGTGLGLYIATLVAGAHGGTLQLIDPLHGGASFEVRLPLSAPADVSGYANM